MIPMFLLGLGTGFAAGWCLMGYLMSRKNNGEQKCPHCGGSLEQANSFKIDCLSCRYSYIVRTKGDKELLITLAVSLMLFFGGIIGYMIGVL